MIDEEIRRALDVDPSPEFLARVRSRIAREPAPSIWRSPWRFVAAGVIAAGIVVSIVVSRPLPRGAARQVPVKAFTPADGSAKAPGSATDSTRSVPPPDLQRNAIGQAEAQSAKAGGRTVDPPDVLLDPRETRALRQLISGVREGRIDLAATQRVQSAALADPEPPADIIIAPITIEPIAPQSGAEGVRP